MLSVTGMLVYWKFGQGFSSEYWEEALVVQIGKFTCDNYCLFWENKIR